MWLLQIYNRKILIQTTHATNEALIVIIVYLFQVISLCPSQYFFSYSYGIFCSVCVLSLPECVV